LHEHLANGFEYRLTNAFIDGSLSMLDNQDSSPRLCLCCGISTAARSIPACWEHWNVLPESLRSSLVTSYGQAQIKLYGDYLIEAVRIWRLSGAWRSKAMASDFVTARAAAFVPPFDEEGALKAQSTFVVWVTRQAVVRNRQHARASRTRRRVLASPAAVEPSRKLR
jgi:hypothetical protein